MYILKKKSLKPGDSLPKETEMAAALGVSRNVVREALSRLRMLGMVETRKSRGTVLARPDILGTLARVLDPLIIDRDTLLDLFELRLVLEMGLVEILYMRKTEKDILELEAIAEKSKGEDRAFLLKNEIAFHSRLYDITGNDTLKRFQIMLLPIFAYVVTLENKSALGNVTHQDLAGIFKNGNKDECREGMYKHLKPYFDGLTNSPDGR